MKSTHATTLLWSDPTFALRRCDGCRSLPYQVWERGVGGAGPVIAGYFTSADAALLAAGAARKRK